MFYGANTYYRSSSESPGKAICRLDSSGVFARNADAFARRPPRSMRALLNQPGLPEQDQSNLIAFTLDAMEERAHHPRRHFGFRHSPGRRLEDLKEFLEDHSLPRKDEFLQRIRKLEENAASDPNADPADSRVLSP